MNNNLHNEEGDSQKYKLGTIVWAYLQGFPWWPSKVIKITGDKYLVEFFENTKKPQCAWVTNKSLKSFHMDTIEEVIASSKQKISKNLEETFRQGIKLAERSFKEMNSEEESDHESECYICGKNGILLLCDG
jgi:hypothetical protein